MRTSLNWGVHKETYRGYGIYWAGRYNVEGGEADYTSVQAARAAIDAHIEVLAAQDRAEHERKLDAGAIRAERDGDLVRLVLPDGTHEDMDIRRFRQRVYEIEEQWGQEVVWC
jgi:hypothetical protein